MIKNLHPFHFTSTHKKSRPLRETQQTGGFFGELLGLA